MGDRHEILSSNNGCIATGLIFSLVKMALWAVHSQMVCISIPKLATHLYIKFLLSKQELPNTYFDGKRKISRGYTLWNKSSMVYIYGVIATADCRVFILKLKLYSLYLVTKENTISPKKASYFTSSYFTCKVINQQGAVLVTYLLSYIYYIIHKNYSQSTMHRSNNSTFTFDLLASPFHL